MKKVDADDFAPGVVASIAGPLFDEPAVDPFAGSKVTPDAVEKVVAGLIWQHQGRENPLPLAKLSEVTGRSERDVKAVVEQLVVTHRLRIGARRQMPWGYFVIVDAEDLRVACEPYESQIFAMWRRLRILRSPMEMKELLGQLVIGE